MENFDFGSVNNVWAMVPMLVYMFYGFFRDYRKNKKSRQRDYVSKGDLLKLSEKLDEHIAFDKKMHEGNERRAAAQKVLNAIALTPINCSDSRFQNLKQEYDAAHAIGVNGIVTNAYIEFCEKRESKIAKKK